MKLVGYGLDKIPGVSTLVEKMSPTLRVFSSDNVPAKRAMADLAETALRFEDNERGITTSFNGPPISRLVQAQRTRMQLDAAETLKEAFSDYRFGQPDVTAPIVRAGLDDLRGAVDGMKLSFNDFKREVTTALFSGDMHPVPQVERRGQSHPARTCWSRSARKAVELNLLDPDAAPKGDPSWFARMWNKEKVTEARPDVVKRFTDWLEGEQTRKARRRSGFRLSAKSLMSSIGRAQIWKRGWPGSTRRRSASKGRCRSAPWKRAGPAPASMSFRSGARCSSKSSRRSKSSLRDAAGRARPGAARAHRQSGARLSDCGCCRGKARVTERDLLRADAEEVRGAFSDRVGKMAAEIVLGERRPVREPSFLHWIKANGGLRDSQGDVMSILGSARTSPGLVRRNGRSLDDLGELIQERFRLQERPTSATCST